MLDKTVFKTPAFTSADEVTQLIRPINNIGISYFAYNVYYDDGSHFKLNSHPEFLEYYYEKELYLQSVFSNNRFHKNMVLLTEWLNQELILLKAEKFNIGPTLAIIETDSDFFECFHFGFSFNSKKTPDLLMNKLDILYRFVAYFKDKGNKLIQKSSENRIRVPNKQIQEDLTDDSFIKTDNLNNFIQETDSRRLYLGDNYLTPRELDIADLLMRGKTLVKITKQLGLSEKTMEIHIANIKRKLDCKTLFDLGFKLGAIGREKLYQKI